MPAEIKQVPAEAAPPVPMTKEPPFTPKNFPEPPAPPKKYPTTESARRKIVGAFSKDVLAMYGQPVRVSKITAGNGATIGMTWIFNYQTVDSTTKLRNDSMTVLVDSITLRATSVVFNREAAK